MESETTRGDFQPEMTRGEKIANLIGVVVPFVGLIVAIVLLWNRAVDWFDLTVMAVTYVLTGLGVTVGFHRLLTHRSFQTKPWIERTFAILGSMAVEGPVNDWVADHRKHHRFSDREGDPHSPHVGHGHGLRGLIHAHVGWLFENQGQADWRVYARELYEDPVMRRINRLFPLWAILSVAIPAALGGLWHGSWEGVLRGAVWGGLVRIFFVHHVTWSVNSICHFFGKRRFEVEDKSTNVAILALPSFGEAWHHNHHAFPRSASHGLSRFERALDPSNWVITTMERLGLAWNVVRISPERQREKLARPGGRPRQAQAA
jgi:stearoyl-CoA desaturase (delta-9 desaturase)